jgi:hypothetical protein
VGWRGQRRGSVPFRDFVKCALPELNPAKPAGAVPLWKAVYKLLKMKERGETVLLMEWAWDVHKTRRGSRSNDPPIG